MKTFSCLLMCASNLLFSQDMAQVVQLPQSKSIMRDEVKLSNEEVYAFFYHHVLEFEKVADQLEAKHDNAGALEVRRYFQKVIGLDDSEIVKLKYIAGQCDHALQNENQKSLLFINENDAPGSPASLNETELATRKAKALRLAAERNNCVRLHIDMTRMMLSEASFNMLSEYLQTKFLPNLKIFTDPKNLEPMN